MTTHDHTAPDLPTHYDGTALVCDLCDAVIAGCSPLPTPPDIDRLLALSEEIADMAKALRASIEPLGTREQWNAWQCLDECAGRAHSAAAWLYSHRANHHGVSRPESVR